MKNKFKKTSLIIPIIFLLFSGAVFYFLYREIKNNIETTKQLETSLQAESSKRNEIKALNNYFQSIEKEKILLETHFVQSSDVVPFLNTLESLASSVETKTEVNSINVTEDNTGLIVEIKNTGAFPQIYRFIALLENAPYELEFLSTDIHNLPNQDNSGNESGTSKWEAVIKLRLVSFI